MTLTFKAPCPTCSKVVTHKIVDGFVKAAKCYKCGHKWDAFWL